jgi:protein transport protein DSL1/ZW10
MVDAIGVPLDRLLQALERLDSQTSLLRKLTKLYQHRICQPALSRASEGTACSIDETSHCLMLSTGTGKKDASSVLACLSSILSFLQSHFPLNLGRAIGDDLSEALIGSLQDEWLTPSIPLSLSELRQWSEFEVKVRDFARIISSYHWPGHKSLTNWVDEVPEIWLEKRRASSLDAVRTALKMRRGPNREVERVEREKISGEDAALIQNGANEEFEIQGLSTDADVKEEEDLSGWGFDDDTAVANDNMTTPNKIDAGVEDATDAWELDDDDNADETALDDSRARTEEDNDRARNASTGGREVTLTETYIITDIPDFLIDIISREMQDGEQMQSSEYAPFGGTAASATLLSLPSSILAMFRAIAPAYYASTLDDGNMHLYNDCLFVVEKLGDLAKSTSLKQLLQECSVLERFARSAYAREMDIQRTILGDLLDGAQGFVNCTRSPFSAQCENAVSSSIDRLRAVHHDWSLILSRSALLQSIGSLLSTALEKIIKDVEDMEDISEAESHRLTAFCEQLSSLADLFIFERPSEESDEARSVPQAVPLTAVYVSNWLRFQYLLNILESSLIDIKFLWTEGELSLEFDANEVVELIEALFAESSHRRSAIAEIRRPRSLVHDR